MSNTFLPIKKIDDINLRKLRYHLATEGCSDSQLSLAKSYLSEATETDAASKANSELAVRWLILAGSEGNVEALELLESCYKMGVGVTPRTRDQVECCLHSTPEQKLAQGIGGSLFRHIAYNTQESIPLEFFQKQVECYMKDEKETQVPELTIPSEVFSGACVTLNDVVDSVHNCLLGKYPNLLLTNVFGVNYVSNVNGVSKFPKKLINIYLTSLGSFCTCLSEIPLVLSFLTFAFICFAMSMLLPPLYFVQYREAYVHFLESVFTCSIVISLLVTSSRMICHCNIVTNVQTWTRIICKVGEEKVNDIPCPNLLPVIYNFVAFVIGLVLFTMFNASQFSSLIQFASFIILTLCLIHCSSSNSKILPLLFLVNSFILALTRLNVGRDSFTSRELFVSDITVNGHAFVIKAAGLLFLTAALLYLILFITHPFHTNLGLLVVSVWCNIITDDLSQNTIKVYLLLLIFLVMLAHKKLGFYLTFYLVFFVSQLGGSNWLVLNAIIAIYILSLKIVQTVTCFTKPSKVTYFQGSLLLFILLSAYSFTSRKPTFDYGNDTQLNVTWDEYSRKCHRSAWLKANIAQTQKQCDSFEGYSLAVEASVDNVVRKYSHKFKVPDILGLRLIGPVGVDLYEVSLHIKGTFRLEAELILEIDGRCEEFVLDLKEGDLLMAVGTLSEGLGTTKPSLVLEQADCISCMEVIYCRVPKYHRVDMKSKLSKSLKFFLHFWI